MTGGLIVIEPEHLRVAAGTLAAIGERQAELATRLRRLTLPPPAWPLTAEI